MSESLTIRKLRIENIGGIAGAVEIEPGTVTTLQGKNGVGKSSVIDGLAALVGGSTADLLNQNADRGEVYIEVSDGTWFRRALTKDGGNALTAGHPDKGRITSPARYLRSMVAAASLSPADFLAADDETALDMILRAAPLRVSDEELAEAVGPDVVLDRAFDAGRHALTVLDEVHRALYDQRTGENRTAKNARATVDQLRQSIPESAQDPAGIEATLAELEQRFEKVVADGKAAKAAAAQEARAKGASELDHIGDNIRGLDRQIAELQAQRTALADKRADLFAQQDAAAAEAVDKAAQPFREEAHGLRVEIDAARQKHQDAIESSGAINNTRRMIEQHEAQAAEAHSRSQELTAALARIDALRSAKAADLPVPGVSVKDGRLFIGDVPAHRANTAQRVRVALSLSLQQPVPVRFVFADRLESLDSETRAAFENEAKKRGVQILGASVTDDAELTVRVA